MIHAHQPVWGTVPQQLRRLDAPSSNKLPDPNRAPAGNLYEGQLPAQNKHADATSTGRVAELLKGIAHPPALRESTLDARGLEGVISDAFVRVTAKVQQYVDASLELRKAHGHRFGGLPPTIVDANFNPVGTETAAIDQQRQLYAASIASLADPKFGLHVIDELDSWHKAYMKAFVPDGRVAVGKITFNSDGSIPKHPNEPPKAELANLRFTYALEGSAALVRALRQAAELNPQKREHYLARATEVQKEVLAIGETFHEQFVDPNKPGRYLLFERGAAPVPEAANLSHNNSQSYLIKGMMALAELDETGQWSQRLDQLFSYIQTQRDLKYVETQASPIGSGLLHEFDFGAPFDPVVTERIPGVGWQAQNGHETVIFGHTLAGVFEGPADLAARTGNREELTRLVKDFVATADKVKGVHSNGLPANAFELIPGGEPAFEKKSWPEGSWQAELLWQFLLRAHEGGVDLSKHSVETPDGSRLSLDRVLARGLELHDANLFDGRSYAGENGQTAAGRGRAFADGINHAAETIEALQRALTRSFAAY